MFLKNEGGYFYLGNPGFICPKNNKGALARACLYALVKYKKMFREH